MSLYRTASGPTAYTLDHPDLWNESAGSSSNTGRGYKPLSPKLSPVHDIRQLVNILRQMDYRDVQGIPGATTPIVKFRDPSHGFDCDLNVNDLGGWCVASIQQDYSADIAGTTRSSSWHTAKYHPSSCDPSSTCSRPGPKQIMSTTRPARRVPPACLHTA